MFDFTVIIPVYKAEKYLKNAIESIIAQTAGFNNIQLIIVDDGSPDESFLIYESYQEKYPSNIICIKQENSGVSAARNAGLRIASGKIITFLDADDMWPEDAFEKAKNFLDLHPEIDAAACKLEYFGAKTGFSHPLNWKFRGDRIIHILKSPEAIQMHIASCFIRKEALFKRKFTEGMKYAEDSKLITSIILDKNAYGALSSVHYLYQKREDESSAIDRCRFDEDFYIPSIQMFHQEILEESMNRFGYIHPYVQYVCAYDIQWRVKKPTPDDILTDELQKEYEDAIRLTLKHIDDKVILKQKNIWGEHKILCLSMKYGYSAARNLVQDGNTLYFRGNAVASSYSSALLKIAYLKVKNQVLYIEGLINTPLHPEDYRITIQEDNGLVMPIASMEDFRKKEKVSVYGHYYYEKWFKAYISIKSLRDKEISFYFSYKGAPPVKMNPGFTDTCRLNTSTKEGYLITGGYVIERKGSTFIIHPAENYDCFTKELKYDRLLLKKKVWKIPVYRIISILLNKFKKKEIWIISDREDAAGDNGEAFFRFMQKKNDKDKKVYFAISKNSPDWNRMKKIGKVINTESIWYKLLFLLASAIISSHANDSTINPFGKGKRFVKDLYHFDFVFLQHGIIKDDLSSWLNKANKDIRIFVTSGKAEYDSIIQGDYGYGPDIVKLTGLPRYDRLCKNTRKQKKIAIITTWRKGLDKCFDSSGNPVCSPDFKETEFFKFYNSLIHNETLNRKMKELDYTGIFCMHPLFSPQAQHFTESERITIKNRVENFTELFENTSLLVTDYSSVFFDFAYLRKPVIYTQFDKEEFFQSHSYEKGYFEYETDGFGPVCYSLDETVQEIINTMENQCYSSKIYEERADNFFIEAESHSENIYKELSSLNP